MEQSNEQKFHDILKGFRNAMLVTHASNKLRARPMAIAQLQPSCEMWFMTDVECAKTHEIESNTRVLVACQNDAGSYISVWGTARVVQDRAKIDQLWQEPYAVFFPKGKSDPSIALIQFKPEEGEYWDGGGLNKVKYLYEAAKAYVAGEKIHVKEGEQHGFVKL
jgi:general stress protein 26